MSLNETHDAGLRSWVASANTGASDFPIQNLPFAVFRRAGSQEAWRGGVAIGDQVLDLARASAIKALGDAVQPQLEAASQQHLNGFMAMGPAAWSALRLALSRALREGAAAQAALQDCLVAQSDVEYTVPAQVGDYTDFYTSVHHATNVGQLFRPDNPLMENYKWVPIGYHGRASSLRVSGVDFRRPMGQLKAPDATAPALKPCARLDYELEMGIYTGAGNAWGEAISMDEAENHIFGLCLLNDWSARDIQAWEYQPLGPFLSKNFATTVSPWIVTLEALEPYRTAFTRPATDPQPLPYLSSAANSERGAFDVQLSVALETGRMRAEGQAAQQITHTSYRHAYWTMAQLVAHHSVNGCDLQPGDLLGTGTLSGPTSSEAGALLELTEGGKKPVALANGESRTFLQDGDAVILRGWCEKPGAARIGFGECRATVLPARQA
ncbi:fumarylacetoacetase [Delftia acidovorans SPH-1]|uniref:fumarylacetoacetase n=2 Tax=Delftia acidovorans TaxID=80866 RepID=A9BTB1_DELAS|nr:MULTISPECIES: fumarylacetoacetase [Delftia]MBA4006915.1 fumarylacetoacetase [Delftia sp.]ABX34676.1 fumarylacetoacetase [Delftia acidovorans SPH-1]MCP4015710.1 fumarylacetoacetase [Delftia sp.]MCP4516406.1 fumarylacetoacetase [Delftia sp.]OLE03740.1 MAG: fumarylacetoacetase [Delftia sp. 13_1_20CM_4_67_18]